MPVVGGLPTIHPFAWPQKRYAKPLVLERAKLYLGSRLSYRSTVRQEGMPLLYDDRRDRQMATRGSPALAPSSVWRWLAWLGGLQKTMRAACQLIREREPASTLHREPWAVPVSKYRSEPRRTTLQQAMQTLVVDSLFRSLFGKEIFPDLATAHAWG